MGKEPLKIVATERKSGGEGRPAKKSLRAEAQAKFDRLWLQEKERFDYNGDALQQLRVERTVEAIKSCGPIEGKVICDLGCGKGDLAAAMAEGGAREVDAVDISQNALKELEKVKKEQIKPIHDFVPRTILDDERYDIVIATELIAELDESLYRLFFSELARLVSREGIVVCSTAIDIDSEDALQRFADLASTEFEVKEWHFSYHYLQIVLLNFITAPARFVRASRDSRYRKEMIDRRSSLAKGWFKLNSSTIISWFWTSLAPLTTALSQSARKSRALLLFLEKISKALFGERAISHALFVAVRRPLQFPVDLPPNELKHKKELWE